MTNKEFYKKYNPDNRMTVTYKDHVTGDTCKGLLLDEVKYGVAGHEYVNVDNFYKRAFLYEVIDIKDTGTPWKKER